MPEFMDTDGAGSPEDEAAFCAGELRGFAWRVLLGAKLFAPEDD